MTFAKATPMLGRAVIACGVLFTAASCVASAQLTAPPNGITVTGRGVVRARADELRFNAVLFGSGVRAQAASAPSADVDGAADAVAKALRDAGVADAAAGYSGGFNLNGPRSVTGTIHHPTREGVGALLRTANAAAAPFAGVALQNINLSFLVDDCSAPEMRAQAAALNDARQRAERIARAVGVKVGVVLNVNEAPVYSNGGQSCATQPDTQPFGGPGVAAGFDSATLGDVFVNVNATVTFAIAR